MTKIVCKEGRLKGLSSHERLQLLHRVVISRNGATKRPSSCFPPTEKQQTTTTSWSLPQFFGLSPAYLSEPEDTSAFADFLLSPDCRNADAGPQQRV